MEEILRPVKRILCILFIALFALSGVAQMAFAEPDGETPQAGSGDGDAQLPDNGIPVVVIEIDETSGHTIEDMNSSDEHNVDCYGTMQIIVPEGFRACDMDSAPESLGPVDLEYIRGRGNSTWFCEKKPYKIKLEEKSKVLGMDSNKHWVLLANAYDATAFKNRFTGWLGDELGFDFTPRMVPVDLVMVGKKDGEEVSREFLGNYCLAEQVRVDENRLNIPELKSKHTDPETITGGYLMKFGQQEDEDDPDRYFTDRLACLANDTPTFDTSDDDYTNEEQKKYIRGYIQDMENALFGVGVEDGDLFTNQDGVRYNEYMDMETAARYWLVQETAANMDMYCTGSSYFYKTEDKFDADGNVVEKGRIFWGPLWDFDLAWGIPSDPEENIEGFWLNNDWVKAMLYDDDPEGFRAAVKREWPKVRDAILSALEDDGLTDQYCAEMRASYNADYEIWKDKLSNEDCSDYDDRGDIDAVGKNFKTWVRARVAWMDSHINGTSDDGLPILDDSVHRVTYMIDGKAVRRDYFKHYEYLELYTPETYDPDLSFGAFVPEDDGRTFLGWRDEEGKITSGQDILKDRVFIAVYEEDEEAAPVAKKGTLTYDLGGGTYNGSTEDIVEVYNVGDVIKVHEAPARKGYKFSYWKGSKYMPGDSYTVSGDHTFTAVWEKDSAGDESGKIDSAGDESSKMEGTDDESGKTKTRNAVRTGDDSRLALWAALMLTALLGLALVLILILKRRVRRTH